MNDSKYIFVIGAPGSKWSSVAKNIYYSPTIDCTDYRDEWTYYHSASGENQLMHLGAYFDPGMELSVPEDLSTHSLEELEAIFDAPFTGTGIRIIKSHVFCLNIDYIRRTWPRCPIVLVYRDDDACLAWWVKCGEFGITYPSYHSYYQNLPTMAQRIRQQNDGVRAAIKDHPGQHPLNNRQLAGMLGLQPPPEEYQQNFYENDIRVMVV